MTSYTFKAGTRKQNHDGGRGSNPGAVLGFHLQGGLALRETIRYNDKNYLNKQYFTVLMKTVLLYEVHWGSLLFVTYTIIQV